MPDWVLKLHIPFFVLSYLLLLGSTVAGILFIVQERRIKRHETLGLSQTWPSLETLERSLSRMILLSFPLLTFGILFGSHWAYRTHHRFWAWDPAETFSLITWGIYAIYMALRWGAGWRGRRSTYLALIGFAIILVSLVALFFSPLHTLKGGS